MSMTARSLLPIIAFVAIALTVEGCGARDDESGGTGVSAKATPVGVWERRYQDAVGQSYLDILELRDDGSYVTHGKSPYRSDRGAYVIENGTIGFRSSVNQQFSKDAPFKLSGANTLTLTTTTPFGSETEWSRSALSPNLRTVTINDRDIPSGLAGVMMSGLASKAQPWRPDALPTAIDVKPLPNGYYETAMHYYSPSSVEEMVIRVTAYDIAITTGKGDRSYQLPLPPNFMDLPQIVERAGNDRALIKASIRAYENAGAAWMSFYDGERRGRTNAALTGEPIKGDVTGYIANYNADWAKAGELWRKAMARSGANSGRLYTGITTRSDCLLSGGSWKSNGLGGGWCDGGSRLRTE